MPSAPCPHCDQAVRFDGQLPEEAVVRCPLCDAEFTLEEITRELPPALIVVRLPEAWSGDHAPPAEELVTAAAELGPAEAEPEYSLADAPDVEQAFSFDEEPAIAAGTAGGTRSRRNQPSQSTPWEMIKVVLGGVLAIPIAQLILWWLPGEWSRDPLSLGPTVGRYAPWVVPAKFRGGELGRSGAPEDTTPEQPGGTFGGDDNPFLNQPAARGDGGKFNSPAGPKRKTSPVAGNRPPMRPDVPPNLGLPETFSPPAAAVVRTQQLAASANSAADEWLRLQPASSSWRTTGRASYQGFSELAAQLATVELTDPSLADALAATRQTLRQLGEDPTKYAMIAQAADYFLAEGSKQEEGADGVLLAGVLQDLRAQGRWFQTTFELAAPPHRRATLVWRDDPSRMVTLETSALVLGRLVKNPSQDLPGFDPAPGFIIQASLATMISPAQAPPSADPAAEAPASGAPAPEATPPEAATP